MQWIGAAILLFATTWIGFEFARQFQSRPRQIRELKNALQMLEAEIVYAQSPIADAFIHISKQIPAPINVLFIALSQRLRTEARSLPDIWIQTIEEYWPMFALNKNEKEILLQFGQTLGQLDVSQQQKHIQLALIHLNRELEEAQEEKKKYSNMSKSLGVLSGLLLIILLL
ncbi:stage III sporulation protein SpoIIIAB [Bacillaceae bacterium S4-13-58]